jgi:hypothetical protein
VTCLQNQSEKKFGWMLCEINSFFTFASQSTETPAAELSDGVTGNTSGFGSEESKFEP